MCNPLVPTLDEIAHWTHHKANWSITSLALQNNKIGDHGASALAVALKATLLMRFQDT